MRENSKTTTFTATVSCDGPTTEFMKESGNSTEWTDKVPSGGKTAENTLANTKRIESMALGNSNSRITKFMKANGLEESRMEKERLYTQTGNALMPDGTWVRWKI